MRSEHGSALRAWGEVAAAQGQAGEAEDHLRQSAAILEEAGEAYETARARLALAAVLIQQGRQAEAFDLLETCLPVFERLGAELDAQTARQLLTSRK